MIQSISIIGSGNVATQLGKSLVENDIVVSHLHSRDSTRAEALANILGATVCPIDSLPNQLTIVCVSDDAISEVINQIPQNIPVVYTSGSVGIDELPQRNQLGVFYPLQTMSKSVKVDMQEVPFLLESKSEILLETVQELAANLSPNCYVVSSEQRRKIHMAAVWINNFTNHIVYQAQKITQEQDLDYQLLLPLLKETLQKLDNQSAFDAQTGPARRGDQKTIDKHLDSQSGTAKELYALLTKSIKETYKNEKL